MFNIGDFLKRVKNVRMKDVYIRDVIVEAIQKITGVKIKPEDIIISSTVATVRGINSVMRSEIFIKKKPLLEEINSKQDLKKITDVR